MNDKTAKLIRKYARLRGAEDVRLNPKRLKTIYERASLDKQNLFKKEMHEYILAIEQGLIMPGESYLHTILSSSDEDTQSDNEPITKKDT